MLNIVNDMLLGTSSSSTTTSTKANGMAGWWNKSTAELERARPRRRKMAKYARVSFSITIAASIEFY